MGSDIRFSPGSVGVLCFSRGRGREHARVDLAIAAELVKLRPDVDVRFVSYGTGVEVFREAGQGVVNLGLPEHNDPVETLIHAARLIGFLQPQLVLAHEEFAAPAAAKIFSAPVVMLTDWFVEDRDFNMSLLLYADEILFLDQQGLYPEPKHLRGRVRYFNPVLREFSYRAGDKARARHELGLPESALVVSVFVHPGRRGERVAPLFDLLLPAFRALPATEKRLVWLAGDDAENLRIATKGLDDIVIHETCEPFDRLMVASDVAITKGNRNIVLELAVLGIPTLTVTHQLNPIDDFRTFRTATNTTVNQDELDVERLIELIEEKAARRDGMKSDVESWRDGRTAVAEHLAQILSSLKG